MPRRRMRGSEVCCPAQRDRARGDRGSGPCGVCCAPRVAGGAVLRGASPGAKPGGALPAGGNLRALEERLFPQSKSRSGGQSARSGIQPFGSSFSFTQRGNHHCHLCTPTAHAQPLAVQSGGSEHPEAPHWLALSPGPVQWQRALLRGDGKKALPKPRPFLFAAGLPQRPHVPGLSHAATASPSERGAAPCPVPPPLPRE